LNAALELADKEAAAQKEWVDKCKHAGDMNVCPTEGLEDDINALARAPVLQTMPQAGAQEDIFEQHTVRNMLGCWISLLPYYLSHRWHVNAMCGFQVGEKGWRTYSKYMSLLNKLRSLSSLVVV
jgi:hypothetical protein